jgi:hypothetical protein
MTIREINSLFTEEIQEQQGTLHDVFCDDSRLFARSILPRLADITPGDRVQGGVAIRASDEEICVHPYVFRLVCRNGMIRAQTIQTRRLLIDDLRLQTNPTWSIREAIRACCAADAFAEATREMRASGDPQADLALSLMPFMKNLSPQLRERFLAQIFDRFKKDRGRSRYDLLNSVTSVARDTTDPQQKWDLEELGGAIAAIKPSPQPTVSERKRFARSGKAVLSST